MADEKKCPFCNESNEIDNKFCIYCGKELPTSDDGTDLDSEDDVSNPKEEQTTEKIEFIHCPECYAPNNNDSVECKECGYEPDFVVTEEAYCLNCGRPVKEGQTKCQCGYELAEIKCPQCNAYNQYANNFCTSCGTRLRSSDVIFPQTKPRGCDYGKNNETLLDTEFLKKESLKNPYQIDNKIDTQTLRSEYLQTDKIITEISSRWWIVSPFNCKSCRSKIEPLQCDCPKCNVTHHNDNHAARIKELKTIANNYIETKRNIDELSNLKWTYKLSEKDRLDYINSLAPLIGESQLKYRQRLFKEYGENCVILFIIKIQWNRYFENICMNCGSEFQPYNLHCPSCSMKKDVPALSVFLNDDYIETDAYDMFSDSVENICREHGGDINYIDDGILGCPECSNYFHYLTQDFLDDHRCPHCGTHFEINASFEFTPPHYVDDWDQYGISYDEWMDMQR